MTPKRVIPREEAYRASSSAPLAKSWTFVQTQGVGNPLKFPDGTEYTFRRILTNNGQGYKTESSAEITDPVLAEKLRDLGKRFPGSVFEVGV